MSFTFYHQNFKEYEKIQEMFEQRSGNELSLAASNGDFEKVRELILADTGKFCLTLFGTSAHME